MELCAGKGDVEVLAERVIERVTKAHVFLSSGSKVRLDGTLVSYDSMFIRAKVEAEAKS